MAPSLPPEFVDLSTALSREKGEVNIMGRVMDKMLPKQTRGYDMMSTFSLADASYGGEGAENFKVRFFKPSEAEHPQIQNNGDIVLLRRLNIKNFKGEWIGLASRSTSWIVFPSTSIPKEAPPNRLMIKHSKLPMTGEPKHSEMLYAIELCDAQDRGSDPSSSVIISSTETLTPLSATSIEKSTQGSLTSAKTGGRSSLGGRDKFSLIKDLHVENYYNIVGQVIKTYSNTGPLEMYVTDYTSNRLLFLYEWDKEDKENEPGGYSSSLTKSKKWPGPFGQMTLMVALWPPHSDFAEYNVKAGDFVLMQNVHIKHNMNSNMEGAMHTDRYYTNKVQISVFKDRSDERVKEVLRRKREYAERFKMQSETFVKQAKWLNQEEENLKKPSAKKLRKKRRLERERQAEQEKEQPLSKKQKKQRARREEENSPESSPSAAQAPSSKPPIKSKRIDLNKNVHSSHPTIPTTPLSFILSLGPNYLNKAPSGITHTLPFQNNKYRATVRVMDFFPDDIADFAVPSRKVSEFDTLSDYEASDTESEVEKTGGLPPDTDDEEEVKRKRRQTAEKVGTAGSEDEEAQEKKWEWRFALILEDADEPKPAKGEQRPRMTVYVAQQDGDFLLKEDAVDLRASPSALDTLREKLFILWGDLEERKTAARTLQPPDSPNANSTSTKAAEETPKSKPFQCCIQEYGIRVKKMGEAETETEAGKGDGHGAEGERGDGTGWERRWRMFGTTII